MIGKFLSPAVSDPSNKFNRTGNRPTKKSAAIIVVGLSRDGC